MKNSTKGALAVGAAATLLLGGAGTLAYWTAEDEVDAGPIEAGSIALTAADCEGFVYTDETPADLIVPGDTVTNDCVATLVLEGDNIGATLTIDPLTLPPEGENALADELTAEVELLDDTGAVISEVEGAGTYTLTAQVTVDYPYGDEPNNDGQDGIVDLDSLGLVAVQTNVDEAP
ncbi:alternate-type signal peptide domain-containing protein [Ruania suaedae]|uniref:alternate-type signal peptide domain-containing protein n=1 Tax=Ruania suaedae TaxID=2897774 RepID=UPI001E57A087|nr:alternate-type signal peptide domain-containing protein [Ruania suaedae]UFU01715.1 alternate-type signal peptide domain-containing protein [Ruania suaedae]